MGVLLEHPPLSKKMREVFELETSPSLRRSRPSLRPETYCQTRWRVLRETHWLSALSWQHERT
jgi:hypothetical protein